MFAQSFHSFPRSFAVSSGEKPRASAACCAVHCVFFIRLFSALSRVLSVTCCVTCCVTFFVTSFVAFSTGILVLILNTGALYIDSKIYGYYSPVFIFGSLPARIAVCLVKAAAYTAVLPGLVSAARRGLGEKI